MEMYAQNPGLGMQAMQQFGVQPGKTALVIVDMQYASTHRDYGFQRLLSRLGLADDLGYYLARIDQLVIPTVQRLQVLFRRLGWPIIFLTVGSEREDYGDFDVRRLARVAFWRSQGLPIPYARVGEDAHRIRPELQPLPGEVVVNKTTASAFNSSSLQDTLARLGLTVLIFAGVATNFCVEMTVRDASDRGYLCFVVDDACASFQPKMHEHALETLRFYGRVVAVSELIREIES